MRSALQAVESRQCNGMVRALNRCSDWLDMTGHASAAAGDSSNLSNAATAPPDGSMDVSLEGVESLRALVAAARSDLAGRLAAAMSGEERALLTHAVSETRRQADQLRNQINDRVSRLETTLQLLLASKYADAQGCAGIGTSGERAGNRSMSPTGTGRSLSQEGRHRLCSQMPSALRPVAVGTRRAKSSGSNGQERPARERARRTTPRVNATRVVTPVVLPWQSSGHHTTLGPATVAALPTTQVASMSTATILSPVHPSSRVAPVAKVCRQPSPNSTHYAHVVGAVGAGSCVVPAGTASVRLFSRSSSPGQATLPLCVGDAGSHAATAGTVGRQVSPETRRLQSLGDVTPVAPGIASVGAGGAPYRQPSPGPRRLHGPGQTSPEVQGGVASSGCLPSNPISGHAQSRHSPTQPVATFSVALRPASSQSAQIGKRAAVTGAASVQPPPIPSKLQKSDFDWSNAVANAGLLLLEAAAAREASSSPRRGQSGSATTRPGRASSEGLTLATQEDFLRAIATTVRESYPRVPIHGSNPPPPLASTALDVSKSPAGCSPTFGCGRPGRSSSRAPPERLADGPASPPPASRACSSPLQGGAPLHVNLRNALSPGRGHSHPSGKCNLTLTTSAGH